jgi:hypothetical protein
VWAESHEVLTHRTIDASSSAKCCSDALTCARGCSLIFESVDKLVSKGNGGREEGELLLCGEKQGSDGDYFLRRRTWGVEGAPVDQRASWVAAEVAPQPVLLVSRPLSPVVLPCRLPVCPCSSPRRANPPASVAQKLSQHAMRLRTQL